MSQDRCERCDGRLVEIDHWGPLQSCHPNCHPKHPRLSAALTKRGWICNDYVGWWETEKHQKHDASRSPRADTTVFLVFRCTPTSLLILSFPLFDRHRLKSPAAFGAQLGVQVSR